MAGTSLDNKDPIYIMHSTSCMVGLLVTCIIGCCVVVDSKEEDAEGEVADYLTLRVSELH